jgi:hypothetical protein
MVAKQANPSDKTDASPDKWLLAHISGSTFLKPDTKCNLMRFGLPSFVFLLQQLKKRGLLGDPYPRLPFFLSPQQASSISMLPTNGLLTSLSNIVCASL